MQQFKNINIFGKKKHATELDFIMNRQAQFNTMRAHQSKPKHLNLGDHEMNVGSFGFSLSPTQNMGLFSPTSNINGAITFGRKMKST